MNLEVVLAKNQRLKGGQSGKRCFIIGNGPSLNAQDITLLEGEISIAVNLFFSHRDAGRVKPPYWVMADPLYWEKPEVWFYPPFDAAMKAEASSLLFVPTGGFSYFSSVNMGPLIDRHYFHYDHSWDPSKRIDFTKGIPPYGQNVVNICLMLAFHLGCNPIYFIGCDYDFAKQTKEEYELRKFGHFYGEDKVPSDHEFMPWEQWRRAIERMDYEFEQLKRYAATWGFDVFNATHGGYLETFPRVDYESLFPKNRERSPSRAPWPAESPEALGRAACRLMNRGEPGPARVLLEEALRRNNPNGRKVAGLEYLMAVCLARVSYFSEALRYARQDRECNPVNRDKSEALIRQIEKTCRSSMSLGPNG